VGSDYAFRIAPGLGGRIVPADRLNARPDDVLLIHHSAGWPQIDKLLALPNPKLLLYHNVTPPLWLWEHAPVVAAHCATGREQLRQLARAVDQTAADSAFNAGELGVDGTIVIPLLVEREKLGAPAAAGPPGAPVAPNIIFVGRLSPHKRQDELIRIFALYRRNRAPSATLTLVGDPISDSFVALLRSLADTLAPGAVRIESGLDAAALGERYRAATAFLCVSEHEGFCIPLTEAFHFGVPVIARPFGAVAEVVGDAGLLVDDNDPAVLCEALHLLHQDGSLRAELRRRGHERLRAFEPAGIAERLRIAVEATLAGRAGRRSSSKLPVAI
jgi:glycosyltransferase involved in cell wall biosynthesis